MLWVAFLSTKPKKNLKRTYGVRLGSFYLFNINCYDIITLNKEQVMDSKYIWHYKDIEYLTFSKKYLKEFETTFNYKVYITPYNEARELIGRIIEEFQYLEKGIKHLIYEAVKNGIYTGKTTFNFDNYISAAQIIKSLKNILIEEKIEKQLITLIKFRNYIVHQHYLSNNAIEAEKEFPKFLFLVFEAIDYISNVTNRITGGATHIPNIFEAGPKN